MKQDSSANLFRGMLFALPISLGLWALGLAALALVLHFVGVF